MGWALNFSGISAGVFFHHAPTSSSHRCPLSECDLSGVSWKKKGSNENIWEKMLFPTYFLSWKCVVALKLLLLLFINKKDVFCEFLPSPLQPLIFRMAWRRQNSVSYALTCTAGSNYVMKMGEKKIFFIIRSKWQKCRWNLRTVFEKIVTGTH